MILNYKVEIIKPEQTLNLRQKNLKPFLSPFECVNPEDQWVTTKHFGLFYYDKLVSVVTLFPEANLLLHCGNPYRLRGMATDINYRGQGFGSVLLMSVLDYLKEQRADLIWCNARIRAFDFYKANGFLFSGDLFELPQIGPHKVMYKRIIPR